MRRFFEKLLNPCEGLVSVLLVILLSGFAFLPLVNRLGYYRIDDWFAIWGAITQGARQLFVFHLGDRPAMGAIWSLVYMVLGTRPLTWQLYGIFLRIVGGLLLFWLLRMVWPKQKAATTLMACLFVIYPGFLEQPLAMTYQMNFFALDAGIFSIALTLLAMKADKKILKIFFTIVSVLAGLGCYLIFEYMVGLEGIRILLLWYTLRKYQKEKILANFNKIIRIWIPYFMGLLAYLLWRLMFYQGARAATDIGSLKQAYLSAPFYMLMRLGIETVKDFFETVFLSWGVPLYNLTWNADYGYWLLGAGIASLAVLLLIVYLRRQKKYETDEIEAGNDQDRWGSDAIWLGAGMTILGLLPVLTANRNVYFADSYDHYTLHAAPGVAVMITGMLFYFLRPEHLKWGFGFLVAISIMTQFNNAAYYAKFWDIQKQVWWQLSWRAPQLKPGTTLIAWLPEDYRLREGIEVWAPANLIYHPQPGGPQIGGEVFNNETQFEILDQDNVGHWFGGVDYTNDFKNSLILSLPSESSCLHVIDNKQPELSEYEPPFVHLAAGISHTDLIDIDAVANNPPQDVFGSEPEHDWCYYYQKASLARQKADWTEVVRLGDEAQQLGLKPGDISEWMPFYEGYARKGLMDEATQLGGLMRADSNFSNTYCRQFESRQPIQNDGTIETFLILNLCPHLERK